VALNGLFSGAKLMLTMMKMSLVKMELHSQPLFKKETQGSES
jgi:hypothetical protein